MEEARQRSTLFVESSTTLKNNRARAVVRCVIWTLILLSLAITVSSVIVWLVLHPRVPLIQINYLSISKFSLLHRHVRGEAEMGFTVKNNNLKMDLWFSRFDILILYKNNKISETYFEPFSQQKRTETSKFVKFAVNSSFDAKEENTATDMSMDMSRKESFNVSMEGLVFITSGNWYNKKKLLRIFCKDLEVEFSVNGTGKLNSDQKHYCKVHFV